MMADSTVEVTMTARTDQAVAGINEVTAAAHRASEALTGLDGVMPAPPRVQILKEPLTYEAHLVRDARGPSGMRAISKDRYSYTKDITLSQLKLGDWRSAEERLAQHAREMKILGEERQRIFHPDVAVEFEKRAVNWTNGQGGYFSPPLWIIEWFATVPTPERVLSALVPQFELPLGAQSVSLPRWNSGGEVAEQQLGGIVTDTDPGDAAVSSAVATIAGNWDVPLQMLEQSPVGAHLDWVAFTNMEARYGYQLELQMLNGSGTASPQGSGNNQLLGLLKNGDVPAGNQVTYTDATPTPARMIESATGTGGGGIAQVVAAIGNNRLLSPECWMMRTSRAAWFLSGTLAFPIALADQPEPGRFDLLSYPVHPSNSIPQTFGASGTEDRIIACRPSDWLLLESEPRMNVYTEVLSGTLQARLQLRRYAAALLRQPSSVAWLQGTGMIVQSGF